MSEVPQFLHFEGRDGVLNTPITEQNRETIIDLISNLPYNTYNVAVNDMSVKYPGMSVRLWKLLLQYIEVIPGFISWEEFNASEPLQNIAYMADVTVVVSIAMVNAGNLVHDIFRVYEFDDYIKRHNLLYEFFSRICYVNASTDALILMESRMIRESEKEFRFNYMSLFHIEFESYIDIFNALELHVQQEDGFLAPAESLTDDILGILHPDMLYFHFELPRDMIFGLPGLTRVWLKYDDEELVNIAKNNPSIIEVVIEDVNYDDNVDYYDNDPYEYMDYINSVLPYNEWQHVYLIGSHKYNQPRDSNNSSRIRSNDYDWSEWESLKKLIIQDVSMGWNATVPNHIDVYMIERAGRTWDDTVFNWCSNCRVILLDCWMDLVALGPNDNVHETLINSIAMNPSLQVVNVRVYASYLSQYNPVKEVVDVIDKQILLDHSNIMSYRIVANYTRDPIEYQHDLVNLAEPDFINTRLVRNAWKRVQDIVKSMPEIYEHKIVQTYQYMRPEDREKFRTAMISQGTEEFETAMRGETSAGFNPKGLPFELWQTIGQYLVEDDV